MGQILVRNLDDAVIAGLKRKAETRRSSLEQTVRDILAEAARPTKEEAWAALDRIRAMGKPSPVSSVEMLRAFRDGDDPDR
jgi:antitoxin FitA